MQIRNRKLSESRSAFSAPRTVYKKQESGLYDEPLRFPASNSHPNLSAGNAWIDSGLQYAGYDHPEVRFNDEDGLVLFDRFAEHHLFIPFLTMLLRQYQQRPESRAMVRQWIGAPDSSSALGFDSLCAYVDLEAEYVRDGLMRWMTKVDRLAAPISADL
jgi:hypothetical protein